MSRSFYIIAALVTCLVEIGIAAYVHDGFVRPYVGDSLAVLLVFFTVRASTRLSVGKSIAAALAIACAVEFGQLIGLIDLLGFERSSLARIVLGVGFDPQDFVAYAAGGAAGLFGEKFLWRKLSPKNALGETTHSS